MFIAVSWNFTFCDFDLSQITLECGLNSPKITFLCEWMCEKCHRLSSDIQVMYEHSTFLLFDVHLHVGEGRLSELAMVWGCTLAILYVTYNSYSKQHHKYLFSSLLIPINLSYFEIDELYQWKNMLWQNCNYSSSATQNTINFCIIAVTIIIYIFTLHNWEQKHRLLSHPHALLPSISEITASHLYDSNEWVKYHFLALNKILHTWLQSGYGGFK